MPRREKILQIDTLLNPTSIAIVGASRDISKIGGRLHKNLLRHGYNGNIYLVNPKYGIIEDEVCYPNLTTISKPIDLTLIAVPINHVTRTLEDAGKSKIKNAIVYSSGFSEIGEEGKEREHQIKEVANRYEMNICGPNCVGIINFRHKIAMSFSQFLDIPVLLPGHIAFISQSGALGGSLLNRAQDMGIGISCFISTGNEAVLDLADFMEYFVEDKETSVIMALIEGIRNPQKFLNSCKKALKKRKPIVVMKVGKSEIGRKAAGSHTGSMTGANEVHDAVFSQNGVVRVSNLDELYLTASTFLKSELPSGNRIGILTSTGGGGVILADKVIEAGMMVPDLSEETVLKLKEIVPEFASVKNPFDLTAQLINDPELFKKSLMVFASDESFDAIIVATSMVSGKLSEKRATFIADASNYIEKPVLTWWAAGSLSLPGIKILEKREVPFFMSAEECVNVLKSLLTYSNKIACFKESLAGTVFQ